ncbi:hypothetical protein [Rhizobium paknamense]|uniref:CSLREA domain-containing protein n=1 Tax=Rhizobium paknamense TaxID=1206817 RepID=A0ABU0I7R8_9HYPH|nr:hypothetical protein [Rhizobium paknamense]MDQ0454273.1 hypothetical protein [Rhizobium paknamense]
MRSKSIIASITAALLAWVMLPGATPTVPDVSRLVVPVDNQKSDSGDDRSSDRVDCRSAATRAVEDSGGQLLSVRLSGGQCVITILVPGSGDNARPRKMTIQVSR